MDVEENLVISSKRPWSVVVAIASGAIHAIVYGCIVLWGVLAALGHAVNQPTSSSTDVVSAFIELVVLLFFLGATAAGSAWVFVWGRAVRTAIVRREATRWIWATTSLSWLHALDLLAPLLGLSKYSDVGNGGWTFPESYFCLAWLTLDAMVLAGLALHRRKA